MNCAEASGLLSAYVDGELEPAELAALEDHLATCTTCQAHARALRSVKHAISRLEGRAEPPGSVRARVRRLSLRKARDARLVRVSALLVAAFAASALLFLARTGERNGSQATLLGELMADHAKYVPEGMPAEIASDDPAQVRSFFEGRVRFSPSVPRLPEARLIGGRLCRLGGEPVQLLFYRRRGLPLSLYVTTLDLPAGKCHSRGPLRACAEKKGPLVFILVGEAPEAELRELLRTARTGDPRSNAPRDATERVPARVRRRDPLCRVRVHAWRVRPASPRDATERVPADATFSTNEIGGPRDPEKIPGRQNYARKSATTSGGPMTRAEIFHTLHALSWPRSGTVPAAIEDVRPSRPPSPGTRPSAPSAWRVPPPRARGFAGAIGGTRSVVAAGSVVRARPRTGVGG